MNLNSKNKYIRKSHFIWLSIVFLISIIFIGVLALGDSERAGENLNFAATATSIVLAVIAIVYTLVDSATHKQSMYDLKKVTEDMEKSVVKTQSILRRTINTSEKHLESLIEMKDELKLHYEESVSNLREEIKKTIVQKEKITIEELDKIFKSSFKEYNKKETGNRKPIDLTKEVADIISSQLGYDFSKENVLEVIREVLSIYGETNPEENRVSEIFTKLLKKQYIFYLEDKKNYSTIPF